MAWAFVSPADGRVLMMPLVLGVSGLVITLALAFVFISIFMMLVILIQKPKGGGLSGAFGGAGGGESAFMGAKAGDALTIVTVGCFIAFLLLAMGLTWTITPEHRRLVEQQEQTLTPAGMGGEDGTAEGQAEPVEQPVDVQPAPVPAVSDDDEIQTGLAGEDPDPSDLGGAAVPATPVTTPRANTEGDPVLDGEPIAE
jgi:preprotein translocase subunit SecG